MKISGKTVMRIDRLFWLLHRMAEFLLIALGRVKRNQNDQVLVIKFMGLGSIIHLSSLCKKNNISLSKIIFLTLEKNRHLCEMVGFNNTRFIRTKNIFLFGKDCVQMLLSMRRLRPSLIVDYERCSHAVGFYRTLLGLFAQSKTISFDDQREVATERQLIYSIKDFNQEELFLKGIEFLPKGIDVSSTPAKKGSPDPYKIIVNVNASNYLLARRYSTDHFEEVVRNLYLWNPALEFYLTGSTEEIPYVRKLEEQLSGIPVRNVTGKWDLEKLREELSTSNLFITCDSGPLHLAVKLGVSTIALWGPTQPEHFGYLEVNHLHNISLKLPCSPCFTHPASSPAKECNGRIDCLKALSPTIIINKAKEIVGLKLSTNESDLSYQDATAGSSGKTNELNEAARIHIYNDSRLKSIL